MSTCTCTKDQTITCIVHPHDCASEKLDRAIDRIKELEANLEAANAYILLFKKLQRFHSEYTAALQGDEDEPM